MFNELADKISKTNRRIDELSGTVDSFDTIIKDLSKSTRTHTADPVSQKKLADIDAAIASLTHSFKILTDEVRNVKARHEQEKTVLETSIYAKLEKLVLERTSGNETLPVPPVVQPAPVPATEAEA